MPNRSPSRRAVLKAGLLTSSMALLKNVTLDAIAEAADMAPNAPSATALLGQVTTDPRPLSARLRWDFASGAIAPRVAVTVSTNADFRDPVLQTHLPS